MCYRLMGEYFGGKEMQEKLVACYAIGWACTDELMQKYPQIVPAESADDLGVVISFDCEAPEEYPAKIDIFPEGAYHIYDYQFFFRYLQENVGHRVELYMEQVEAVDQAA